MKKKKLKRRLTCQWAHLFALPHLDRASTSTHRFGKRKSAGEKRKEGRRQRVSTLCLWFPLLPCLLLLLSIEDTEAHKKEGKCERAILANERKNERKSKSKSPAAIFCSKRRKRSRKRKKARKVTAKGASSSSSFHFHLTLPTQ